ncbi:MAG: hypothetical protein R3C56_05975 [Pirellulaceae bacterium]
MVPDQDVFPVEVHELQQADMARLKNWNQLFAGRSSFKIASLIALAATCLITLSVLAWNIGTYWQRQIVGLRIFADRSVGQLLFSRVTFQPFRFLVSTMLLADPPSLNISFAQVLIAVAVVVAGAGAGHVGSLCHQSPIRTRTKQALVKQVGVWGLSLSDRRVGVDGLRLTLVTGQVLGYTLLFHVAASGGFVFLMVAIAFLYLPTGPDYADDRSGRREIWWAARWSAWALVVSSLVAAGTMLVSMLPVLDTQGLLQMATLHRYAGLAVVVSAIFHLYSLTCARLGWRLVPEFPQYPDSHWMTTGAAGIAASVSIQPASARG